MVGQGRRVLVELGSVGRGSNKNKVLVVRKVKKCLRNSSLSLTI